MAFNYRHIPSEKMGQNFGPPEMAFLALTIIIGLEGMHFGHFWPPPGPLGGVRGGMEGSGGVPGTKNCNFFGSHIWVPNWEILECMN